MKQHHSARLSANATMTPQLIQSIRFLQCSAVEIEAQIAEMLDSNVMLEAADETARTDASDDAREDAGPDEAGFDDTYVLGSSSGGTAPEDRQTAETTRSLRARLIDQLEVVLANQHEAHIALAILDLLDPTGYLDQPLSTARVALAEQGIAATDAEIEAIRQRLLQLEPGGIGALDLRECLLSQLIGRTGASVALARTLLSDHLEELAAGELAELAAATGADTDAVGEAVALIRRLNPKPGLDAGPAEAALPDVIVEHSDDGWHCRLNPAVNPTLSVNTTYERLLGGCDKASAGGLHDQLAEARWFIRSIEMRRDTILRTTRAIFARQAGFLTDGESALTPLTLKEIADDIGMHESTVCRVTTQKFVATPRGVFELKFFFSSQVGAGSNASAAGSAVRAMIRDIVASEARGRPFCDADIAAILARRGIRVARRTVAKYRESMGIAPAKARARAPRTLHQVLAGAVA